MFRVQSLDIAGPAGRLESILILPEREPVAAAVVCHPHPLYGGTLHSKVVFRAARALQRNGVAALRFNFRGAGRSEGTHDQGRGEQEDVRAALKEMEGRFPGLPLILGGFSFGAWMALLVGVPDPRVRALFALGLPLPHLRDTSFLEGCRKPRLFVQGEKDEFGSGKRIEELTKLLPPPCSVVVVPRSNHLFTGHLDRLQEAVATWIATHPWETG